MKRRIVVALAAAVMLLGLPLVASANAVPFVNISGVVKSLTVQVTTVDGTTGKLKKDLAKFTNGGDTGTATLDTVLHVSEFDDTVVMSSSNHPDFTTLRVSVLGDLLLPGVGNSASGPAAFELLSPAVAPANGEQLVIYGAVSVKATSNSAGTKLTVVTKFQPSSVVINTYTGGIITSTTFGDAKITVPALIKAVVP